VRYKLGAAFLVGVACGLFAHQVGMLRVVNAMIRSALQLPNTYQAMRTDLLVRSRVQAPIVVVGDSIAEQGDWQGLLGRVDVLNRGISSDQTTHVLARLPSIQAARADTVILIVGINDLHQGTSPAVLAANVRRIIDGLAPSRVILAPILNGVSQVSREVEQANGLLGQACAGSCVLLSVPQLAGVLTPAHTYDRVHLTAAAYAELAAAIAPLLSPERR
jgi:lysophospholipase L1-like esterase